MSADPDDKALSAAFARRAAELGLELTPTDLAELERGWRGMQSQLERVRASVARDDVTDME
jgi:hypothetical protein